MKAQQDNTTKDLVVTFAGGLMSLVHINYQLSIINYQLSINLSSRESRRDLGSTF